MIQGNDGGVYATQDGAKSWRYLNNLPIEQFYMVAADNNVPYMLCGGLQDNNAWCGMSSGPRSEEQTSELQAQSNLVCRLLLEKKKAELPGGAAAQREAGLWPCRFAFLLPGSRRSA